MLSQRPGLYQSYKNPPPSPGQEGGSLLIDSDGELQGAAGQTDYGKSPNQWISTGNTNKPKKLIRGAIIEREQYKYRRGGSGGK